MLPLLMIIGDGLKLGLKYDWGLHYHFSLHRYIARKTEVRLQPDSILVFIQLSHNWFHGMPQTG